MVTVRVELDQSATYAMIDTFTENLQAAEQFAINQIKDRIRYEVFGTVVYALGARAGEGFPRVYREHLSNFMRLNVPINAYASGDGIISINYDFNSLGDYTDLELGAHHQALIAIDKGSLATTSKGGLKYIIHPPVVNLPYQGEPLENDSDKRQDFWERVIVDRELDYAPGLRRGASEWTIEELLGGNVPTFEDVAAARVFEAWIPAGVAPEWLWLENGFTESEPRIYPVDFTQTLENITYCVADKIYEEAIIGLVRLAEAAGGAIGVGSKGRPYERASGQFAPYRQEINTADISECLGSI